MKRILGIIVLSILFIQCGQDGDLLIAKNQLGKIGKNTTIDELDKIFKRDSIEKFPLESETFREYRVFAEDGKPSLVFFPSIKNDSIIGLQLVKIYSSDYMTEKGISTTSSFGDVAENYSIDKIEPSFSSAILFINEINATISLNKEDLNLDEFDMSEIHQDQIPDEANIKFISLWFD